MALASDRSTDLTVATRSEMRAAFPAAVRIRLLEQDNDEFDLAVKGLQRTMRQLIAAHLAVVVSIIGGLCVLAFR